jgi:hypothetical protein
MLPRLIAQTADDVQISRIGCAPMRQIWRAPKADRRSDVDAL